MSKPVISILICTLPERDSMFCQLLGELQSQIIAYPEKVEILFNEHIGHSIGRKRNDLLDKATGEYVACIDDDDEISYNYIELLLEAAASGCDCASLKGEITINGGRPEIFEHSLKYDEWRTTNNEIKYERYPNHLNMIKADIAKQFKFPETNHGEDHDWSKQLHKAGALKSEHYISDILYYYNYISNK